MAVRHITTVSTTPATIENETALGSNQYDVLPFNPMVVEFDLDLDRLSISNISLINDGDAVEYIATDYYGNDKPTSRRHYIVSNDRKYLLCIFNKFVNSSTGYPPSLYVSNFDPTVYPDKQSDGYRINYIKNFVNPSYIAGVYVEDIQTFIVIWKYRTTRDYYYDVNKITNSSAVNKLLSIFYGSNVVSTLSIQLVSPADRNFNIGQSSKLIFKLANDAGVSVSANITIDAYGIEPGWDWDSVTQTLTYNEGSRRQTMSVSAVYDDVEYQKFFIFNPPYGTSPYQPGGTSGIGGGNGNFGVGVPNDNVSIDTPSGSNFGYVGGSMFTHYALSGNQIENFGEWLWTDNLGLSLWKTVMEKIFNETADGLIGLMAFPFNISTLPNIALVDGTIKAGNLPTGIPARILGSPYTQVDWGTIQLTEYWGNFLDYAPHTKIELYLPWSTGFVPIDPHQCLPGSLSVRTNIDLQKGTCTHNVFAGTTVLGVYEGQVGYEIPLLASNFSAKLAGATVAAVAGLTMGVAGAVSTNAYLGRTIQAHEALEKARPMLLASSGGDLDLYQQAYAGLRQTVMPAPYKEGATYRAITSGAPAKIASASSSATAKQPVNVSRNGSFSGSSAGMAIQYPYVIISRPEQNIPTGYGHYYGYPSNVGVINMLQLKGYTEIGAIHLNGIRAFPDEIAELDDILKGGFII